MKRNQKLILALIIIIALVLRFWQLSEYPVGFHIDEASLGYNAYSLLKTARDENGQLLPLHIDMFGDFRPAGYQYLAIIPVKLLGLNELATRFPSALFGALTPIVIFLLTKLLFRATLPALLAAGLIALSPWHLAISRASAETIIALFLLVMSVYYLISGLKGEKKHLKKAVLFNALSMLFYHTSRVFGSLLFIGLTILLWPLWQKQEKAFQKKVVLSLLVVTGLGLLLIFGTGGVGKGRFTQVSIFHYPEIRLVLAEQIREAGLLKTPVLLTRTVHNKIVNYSLGYVKEYLRYFSLNFLFIEGGLPAWYVVPNMGLFYLIELPALLLGLFLLLSSKKRLYQVPVVWLVFGPMIAALTRDDVPNVQRALVMLPALVIIISFGFWQAWLWLKKRLSPVWRYLVLAGLFLAFFWQVGYFFHQYFIHAKIHKPWWRNYGFKEMVLEVSQRETDFDKVIVSKVEGGIYMHFLFFKQYDPALYQSEGSPKDKEFGGFGKYIFVPDECILDPTAKGKIDPEAKVLKVASGKCDKAPFIGPFAKDVKRPDGTEVFRIYPGGKDE